MGVKIKSIWLSYDLGLKGNYNGLFTFLDNHRAIECGNGLAFLKYQNKDSLNSDELIKKIEEELAKAISPAASDRIYVIWRDDEDSQTKVRGKFLFGHRKTPPWNGYATKNGDSREEEEI